MPTNTEKAAGAVLLWLLFFGKSAKSSTPKSSTPKSSTPKSSTPKSSTPKSSSEPGRPEEAKPEPKEPVDLEPDDDQADDDQADDDDDDQADAKADAKAKAEKAKKAKAKAKAEGKKRPGDRAKDDAAAKFAADFYAEYKARGIEEPQTSIEALSLYLLAGGSDPKEIAHYQKGAGLEPSGEYDKATSLLTAELIDLAIDGAINGYIQGVFGGELPEAVAGNMLLQYIREGRDIGTVIPREKIAALQMAMGVNPVTGRIDDATKERLVELGITPTEEE